MKKDLMIDIETLGTDSGCIILQFGGSYFDRYSKTRYEEILINISLKSSFQYGFHIRPENLEWWLRQPKPAIKSVLSEPRYSVPKAINIINNFMADAENIWSHSTFDFPILMGYFRKLDITPKFDYKNNRDIRTLIHLAAPDPSHYRKYSHGLYHNALDDCIRQIKYCRKYLRMV